MDVEQERSLLNEAQWLTLFAKYKTTPQFQLLNFDFTLSNFKFIFFGNGFTACGQELLD
jgi:heme A synthase